MVCTPYEPDQGLFLTVMNFEAAAVKNASPYRLTRSQANGDFTITVEEGGVAIVTHICSDPVIPKYMFYGSNNRYLLILEQENRTNDIVYTLYHWNLASAARTKHTLYANYFYNTENPDLNVQPSPGNGLALFLFVNADGSVKDPTLIRSDTGQEICGFNNFTPSGQVVGKIDGNTFTINGCSPSGWCSCILPAGELTITPSGTVPFGTIRKDTTKSINVDFRNTGSDCLTVTNISSSAHFRPIGFAQFDLQPNETRSVQFEFDPNGTAMTFTETVNVTCNPATLNTNITFQGTGRELISSIQFSTTSVNFGSKALGKSVTKTLTIINDGETDWQISYPATSAGSVFDWGPAANNEVLGAGQPPRSIDITFTPTAENNYSDTLVISYGSSQLIQLMGTGIMDVSFNQTSFNYGSVPLGKVETSTLRITNNNGIPIQISHPATPAGSLFDWGPAINVPLPAGQTKSIVISFTPNAEVRSETTLTITYNGKNQNISLEGVGLFAVSFSKTILDFGTIPVGSPVTDTFRITNNNGIPIQITYLAALAGSVFDWGLAAINKPIPADQFEDVDVTFNPSGDTSHSSVIDITYDGRNQPITLRGTGCIPNVEINIPDLPSIIFGKDGKVEEGLYAIQQIKVNNIGDIPANIRCKIDGADSSLFGFQDINGSIVEPVTTRDYIINPVTACGNVPTGSGYVDVTLVFHAMDTPRIVEADFVIEEPIGAEKVRIPLSSEIIAASSVDVAVVLDRSGSMSESAGIRAKHEASLSSARLFIKMLRSDYDDRLAIVRFNDSADVVQEITTLTSGNKETIHNSLTEETLHPTGRTSIAAGMMIAQDQIDSSRDSIPTELHKGMIVLTDGKDNTPWKNPNDEQYYSLLGGPMNIGGFLGPVEETLPVPIPVDTRVYSVGLGDAGNFDQGRLSYLASITGGYHQTIPEFADQSYFDLEKFYVQVFMDMVDMSIEFDPLNTINPGEQHTTNFEVDKGDSRIMVVIYNHGGRLPFTLISPSGEYFTMNMTPNGYGSRYEESDTGHFLEIILPLDTPSRYVGKWILRIIHDGKLESKPMLKRMSKRKALPQVVLKRIRSAYIRKTTPITYSLTIGVKSSLKLHTITPSKIVKAGDVIKLEALILESGLKVGGWNLFTDVVTPTGQTWTVQLKENSNSSYVGEFNHTAIPGAYSFTYYATGKRLGGKAILRRETTKAKYIEGQIPIIPVQKPTSQRTPIQIKKLLRLILIITIILSLLLITSIILSFLP